MKQHGTVPAKGRLMGMQFPLMLKGGEYFEKTRCADWTVPRSTDKEKSALSQNSGKLHGLAPDLKRSKAVFQVDPLIVVGSHILRHRLFDFGPARGYSPIQAFRFQRPEKISVATSS